MSRRARSDFEGYFYHVICRGQRKNPLFFSDDDKDQYIRYLNEVSELHDCEVHAYCLMRNHVHLLIKRNKHLLSSFMHRLNTNFALYFNKKYGTVGHVLQGRYKALIVLDESYLMLLVDYIHENPVKAGYCVKQEEYKYSSAASYLLHENSEVSGLQMLRSDESNVTKRKEHLEIFKDSIGSEDEYLSYEKRSKGREKGKTLERREPGLDIITIAKRISKEMRVDLQAIINGKNKRELKDKRLLLVRKLIKKGFKRVEIARLLNYEKTAIGKMLSRE